MNSFSFSFMPLIIAAVILSVVVASLIRLFRPTPIPSYPSKGMSKKNPRIAALISLISWGGGQLYNGDIRKGISFIIGGAFFAALLVLNIEDANSSILFFLLILAFIPIYSVYDAYKTAQILNLTIDAIHLSTMKKCPYCAEMIKEDDYRRDLYYRLAVIPLMVPPLRERKEDILPLADHFLKKYSNKYKRKLKTLDHTIQQILLDYSWPGNIRELENCIEHALAMTKGSNITPSSLPVQIVAPRNAITGNNYLSGTKTGIAGATKQNDEIFTYNTKNILKIKTRLKLAKDQFKTGII